MADTPKFVNADYTLKGKRLREGLKGWGRFIDGEFIWGIGDDPFPPEPEGVPMVVTNIDSETKMVTLNTPVRSKSTRR